MQPSLFQSKAPTASDVDVTWMLRCLDGRGWTPAQQIVAVAHNTGRDWSDRTIRAIAAASAGRIISGQKGYCRVDQATVEEVNHAAAWLEHQAAQMNKRAREIRRAMHQRIAAA